jgi:hypothetical protein
MTADKAFTEARARIIWGESTLSVRGFLLLNGVPDTVADAKIREFIAERNTEIRGRGVRDIFTGVILMIASTGVLLYPVFVYGPRFITLWFSLRATLTGMIALVFIGLCGTWKLLRGIIYLVRPQSERKSISDITE